MDNYLSRSLTFKRPPDHWGTQIWEIVEIMHQGGSFLSLPNDFGEEIYPN